jgi:long-chain acyl-CoA synthetase
MEYPWLKSYPPGIPHKMEGPSYQNLTEFFDDHHLQRKHQISIENMGVQLTYDQVGLLSSNFGAYLQKVGLNPGDRIAIQLPNILQFPVAFIGALKAGLIVVPTNPLYTPREMEHQFNDAGVKAIVILSNFAHNLEKIIARTSIKHVIVTRVGDLLGTVKGSLINFVVKSVKKTEPEYKLSGVVKFKSALREGKAVKLKKIEANAHDLAVLQYTGGTTGLAKGAQLSHGNILWHTKQIASWLSPGLASNSKEIIITALPLYHIYSLTVNLMGGYHVGGKNVLITNPRDIPGFIKTLRKQKFTLISGVNTLYNALLNHPSFQTIDFSSLRVAGSGAMALQSSVAKRWKDLTGVSLVQGYGLSENSGALSCNPLIGINKIDTVGLPLPNTELRILDELGNSLPQGEAGEICARGPQIMKGYWNSDNNGVFFDSDWFRTGDIGIMDPDGYFKIVDRKKDMISVSGLKVFPNEIESVVSSHPKVLECAAVGVHDETCGEAVKLFVVKRDVTLTELELKKYCIENFVKYKIPKYIVFIDSVPKSPVGKVLRRELRDTMTC